MKSYLFIISLSIIFITACKKDSSSRISTGTYTTNGIATFKAATMYVKDGFISDTNIIKAYLTRAWGAINYITYTSGGKTNTAFRASLSINGNTATEDSTHTDYSISHQSGNILLLTQKDSVQVASSDGGSLGCGNVFNRIRKNVPDYTCVSYAIPGSSGNSSYTNCLGQPKIPLVNNGNSIDIPLLTYYFSANRTTNWCSNGATLTDFFNSDAIRDIQANDTLIIQTGIITLTKQ